MGDTVRFLERRVIYSGQYVFHEGEEGDRAFLVEKGCISIERTKPDGTLAILGQVGKGGIFGEMALVDDQPRMASAVARQESTIVIVGRDQFREKVEAADPFIRALLKIFVRNIRQITDRSL